MPVHKKNEKNVKGNYRPISLLPIFGKILEKLIFDSLYSHLVSNDLLNPNQSGFRPGDSTVNQLLSITHTIFKAFDCNPPLDVRSVYLDISKALDSISVRGGGAGGAAAPPALEKFTKISLSRAKIRRKSGKNFRKQ